MLTAAVYIRVSTEEQTEFSPDAQLRAIRQYAEKNEIYIDKKYIFADEGISGRRADKRPEFQRMIGLAKLKPKPFDVILVHKFDRFARSREDSVVYKSLLRKDCNVKVVSITEQLEDDKFSIILEAMLEAMAEYYSLNLSEEVKKGMTEKARRGELQTPAPFGYRMESGLLTPHDEEAEIVKQIFYKYAKENVSLRTIAKFVNSLGFKTKMGNAFDTRLVEYIIYNPTYIGKMRWTPTGSVVCKHDFDNPDTFILDGKHKAIVDSELWNEANKKIRARKKERILPYEKDRELNTHWLRGVLKCAECGATLSYGKGSGGKQGAYRCNKYLAGACHEPQRITIGKIEKIVIDTLKEDLKVCPQIGYRKDKKINTERQLGIDSHIKRLGKLRLQLGKAREFALAGIDTAEEYRENKKSINAKIEESNKALKELEIAEGEIETVGNNVKDITDILLSDCPLSEKNRTLREVISKIVYNKKDNILDFFYYFMV